MRLVREVIHNRYSCTDVSKNSEKVIIVFKSFLKHEIFSDTLIKNIGLLINKINLQYGLFSTNFSLVFGKYLFLVSYKVFDLLLLKNIRMFFVKNVRQFKYTDMETAKFRVI